MLCHRLWWRRWDVDVVEDRQEDVAESATCGGVNVRNFYPEVFEVLEEVVIEDFVVRL